MPYTYQKGDLYCEDVRISDLSEAYGTPLYVYSLDSIRRNFKAIDGAFSDQDHLVCYAMKANSNPAILRELASLGAGMDVVSGGELQLALDAGVPPKKIVFAGVGKTDSEIRMALSHQILALNVESTSELEVIGNLAMSARQGAAVSLRVNPDIDIHGHPYITTGRSADKFGIPVEDIPALLQRLSEMDGLRLVGLHAHLGSQIDTVQPYVESAKVLKTLIEHARGLGLRPEFVDIGGGIGVRYALGHRLSTSEPSYDIDVVELGRAVGEVLKPLRCRILIEPGRALVADSGILVTRVLYLKQTHGKKFVVADAGMNDLIRPSLYGAFHEIVPLRITDGTPESVDVVGPICESGDFLARDRKMPPLKRGDQLAVMTAGAYGFVLSSNYNSRPRAAEVLVDGLNHEVVRSREQFRTDPIAS